MALQNLDYSGIEGVSEKMFKVASSYNPLGSVADGFLKGMELRRQHEKDKREEEKFEMEKEDNKRKGALADLDMEYKSQLIEEKKAELKQMPDKLKLQKDELDLKIQTAKNEQERTRLLLDKARKEAEDIDINYKSLSDGALLIDRSLTILENETDPKVRAQIVKGINSAIKSDPVMSSVYFLDGEVTADEKGIDRLKERAEMLREDAQSRKQSSYSYDAEGNRYVIDPKTGDYKLDKTAADLRKEKYNPTPMPEGNVTDNNKRVVSKMASDYMKSTGMDYDFGPMSSSDVDKSITRWYLGIQKEREEKNLPVISEQEMIKEAFERAFPVSNFEVSVDSDGKKKATYVPNRVKESFDVSDDSGKKRKIEVLGDADDNGMIRVIIDGVRGTISMDRYKELKSRK